MGKFESLRKQMIDYQLAARGLHDEAVLKAVSAVPREEFVSTELVEFAYSDSPLPIAARQTISQFASFSHSVGKPVTRPLFWPHATSLIRCTSF